MNITQFASFRYNGEYIALPIDGEYRVGELIVTVELKRFDDALDWTVRFFNSGDSDSGRISDIRGLDLTLPCESFEWRGIDGDYCDGRSFMPLERTLGEEESFKLEPKRGRPSQETAFPFFDFSVGDENAALAIGWSGQWYFSAARKDGFVRLSAGQSDCDFYLKAGESARSIRVLLYKNGGGIDETRHGFRRMLREHCSPYSYLGKELFAPLSAQDFDRYFWNNPFFSTIEGQKRIIESSSKCGVEVHWLDAAWFREGFPSGVGNYEFAEGFKGGLRGISDDAHAKGQKFMVWFEPERIHIGSDVYAAHGDGDGWLLNCESAGENRLYNLGDENALAWLKKTLIDFIRDNGIDIYREDFNIDPLPFWRENDPSDRIGMTEMKFVEGFYSLWDAILAEFPRILIDNCSSGGRRIDLETVSRALPCWRSDTGCVPNEPERPVGTWHQNQTLNLSRYLPYHLSSSWFEKAYEFRSGMTMGIACAFDFMRDDYDPAPAKSAIDELKRLRRYWDGDFYALTEPSLGEDTWCAYALTLGEGGCAVMFRRRECTSESFTLSLPNIDKTKSYRLIVSDENFSVTESELDGAALSEGLTINTEAPFSSASIEYYPI